MAITQAMCTSFKKELLEGVHNFKNSGGDTFKLALFAISSGGKSSTTATLGATTTALVTTGEVASSGTYATGGGSLTRVDPTTSGTTAFTDFADVSFTTATITARGALIYNSSDSNKAVAVLDFGGNKTSTSGTFTVQFPTANGSNAIIRIA
tara:strand:+ start:2654 stop:3109 length:456 start_codon:yes stop_codon:yes gene_type:complete